jgi:hypothetical protein
LDRETTLILYCAADLLWATRIRATAEAAGVPSRPARDMAMLEARLADSPVRGLIVDLEAPAALNLARRLRDDRASERDRAVRLVAFGPHIAVESFEAARRAGVERVMARSAFDRSLPAILADLNSEPSKPM